MGVVEIDEQAARALAGIVGHVAIVANGMVHAPLRPACNLCVRIWRSGLKRSPALLQAHSQQLARLCDRRTLQT